MQLEWNFAWGVEQIWITMQMEWSFSGVVGRIGQRRK